MTNTYTLAALEVSPATFQEIARRLKQAGYDYAFHEDSDGLRVDMSGILLVADADKDQGSAALLHTKLAQEQKRSRVLAHAMSAIAVGEIPADHAETDKLPENLSGEHCLRTAMRCAEGDTETPDALMRAAAEAMLRDNALIDYAGWVSENLDDCADGVVVGCTRDNAIWCLPCAGGPDQVSEADEVRAGTDFMKCEGCGGMMWVE